MIDFYKRKEILITGGAGTLGKEVVKQLIQIPDVHGIRIYSRDEEKHRLFKKELEELNCKTPVSFLIGDIRDLNRLTRTMNGVDIVIHTAAMKQIPHCEFNPIEAVRTNVEGTCNVIDAAVNNIVQNVMLISTDKACYPVNLYGATKATAEKLFLHANVYAPHTTKFSVCRYGNVFGSRGSVVQIWKEQYEKTGKITITNNDMTRFWIQIQDVAKFILNRLAKSKGSEIFVPNMKSCDMKTFAKAVQPKAGIVFTGVRTGEKIHECLITKEESEYTKIFESHYEIKFDKKVVAVPFCVTSANSEKYTVEEMKEFLEEKK